MAILSSIPVLNCRSIEQTLAFYQQLLQFVVVNKRKEKGELCWVHLMHGDTTLMLQSEGQQETGANHVQKSKITLYFTVNNIKEIFHYIKVKYNAVSELKNTDYQMQEFSLLDPEGNTITIGQNHNRYPDC